MKIDALKPGLWAVLQDDTLIWVPPRSAPMDEALQSTAVKQWILVPACANETKQRTEPQRHADPRRALVLVALMAMAVALFSACGGDRHAVATTPSPVAAAAAAAPLPTNHSIELQACWDASTSYPPDLRTRAISEFGVMLTNMLRPGAPGIREAERWITHNSRSPQSSVYQLVIPSIPPDPIREPDPPEPVKPNRKDAKYIYDEERYQTDLNDWQDEHDAWQREVGLIQADYQAAVDGGNAALDLARQTVETRNSAVLAAIVPPASGSDLGGCLQAAADAMSHAEGRKIIVIASDMDPFGEQNIYNPNLSGTEVFVVNYWCDRAIQCEERKRYWEQTLALASRVEYYTPGEDINTILSEGRN